MLGLGALLAAQLWGLGRAGFVFFALWLPMSSRRSARAFGRSVLGVEGRRVRISASKHGSEETLSVDLPPIPEGWLARDAGSTQAALRLADDRLLVASFDEETPARAFLQEAGIEEGGSRQFRLSEHVLGPSRAIGQRAYDVFGILRRVGGALLVAMIVAALWRIATSAFDGLSGLIGVFDGMGRVMVLLLSLMMAIALMNLAVVPSVHLGLDGMVIRSFGTRRFIAYRDVRAVQQVREGVVVELVDGRSSLLPLRALTASLFGSAGIVGRDAAEVRRLSELLRSEIAERVERAHATPDLQVVRRVVSEPSGRDGALLSQQYRAPGVTTDAVVELMESPAATPEQRVGAARALAALGDPALKSRIRVAAEACVEPALGPELLRIADSEGDPEHSDGSGVAGTARRARA